MRDKILPYGHQSIDESDIEAVVEALKADRITTGEKVSEFECKVASYCGAKYAVAVSSGTAGLHAACSVAGITKGDEVITTPITFVATVASIIHCGGTPVLADVMGDTVNIDPVEIESEITKKTKAILPVDFAGHPADLGMIKKIAKRNGLVVIEDACHALGAEYMDGKIGNMSDSDMTVFSFHPVKVITAGEGGMILTDSAEYYEKLRRFRDHNIIRSEKPWRYWIQEPGFNYRITDIQCALGISQLKKLDYFIERRREIASMYNRAFADVEEIITPPELEYVKSAYHLYVIQLRTLDRDKVIEALAKEGIGAQVHYIPIHYHSFMQKVSEYRQGDFPNAEAYYKRAISLPIFPAMSGEDVMDVVKAVKRMVK
ncbi:hypothetical protein LCGC14_1444410 [marine sediment metagenome]|uniref:UDP-4-amino-4, 6-dideoxy-N-acetyl-beta-L-altrosamine transaminase n=1 Tax=marine sediment metagenome TaxID=412755 RepID=A0A0F9MLN8_9ZZZZ